MMTAESASVTLITLAVVSAVFILFSVIPWAIFAAVYDKERTLAITGKALLIEVLIAVGLIAAYFVYAVLVLSNSI